MTTFIEPDFYLEEMFDSADCYAAFYLAVAMVLLIIDKDTLRPIGVKLDPAYFAVIFGINAFVNIYFNLGNITTLTMFVITVHLIALIMLVHSWGILNNILGFPGRVNFNWSLSGCSLSLFWM
jgi:hypothetical protein